MQHKSNAMRGAGSAGGSSRLGYRAEEVHSNYSADYRDGPNFIC